MMKNYNIKLYDEIELKRRLEDINKFVPDHVDLAVLSLEFTTLVNEFNLHAAFLVGWNIFEMIINQIMKTYMENSYLEKLISKDRKNIYNSPNWTISHKIFLLHAIGLLPDIIFHFTSAKKPDMEYIPLRSIRNDLTHKNPNYQIYEYQVSALWSLINVLLQYNMFGVENFGINEKIVLTLLEKYLLLKLSLLSGFHKYLGQQ